MNVNPEDAAHRFEVLFRQHHDELTRFAVRRVGADAAADVVATTFLTTWRRLADVPVQHERAWLFAAARHVISNEQRARRRREQLIERAEAQPAEPVADHAVEVADRMRVRAVLARLSERDQEVLRLSQWDQLSDAEGARVLGCSTTAYKVRLHRARRRFAAGLQEREQVQAVSLAPEEIRP